MFKNHLKRPKNTFKLLPRDKVLEAFCATLLIIYWVLSIMVHHSAPETIPVHFDINGVVDSFGPKAQLFKGPKIATAIYLLITVVSFFPQYFNYGEEITRENADTKYRNASRTLRILKLIVISVLLCVSSFTIFKLTKILSINPILLIILTMCLFMIPTIYYIMLNKRNSVQ